MLSNFFSTLIIYFYLYWNLFHLFNHQYIFLCKWCCFEKRIPPIFCLNNGWKLIFIWKIQHAAFSWPKINCWRANGSDTMNRNKKSVPWKQKKKIERNEENKPESFTLFKRIYWVGVQSWTKCKKNEYRSSNEAIIYWASNW